MWLMMWYEVVCLYPPPPLPRGFGLVYWGVTPQQQPGSYQGGEMMMKSVFWWRKPEYPEETTDLPTDPSGGGGGGVKGVWRTTTA